MVLDYALHQDFSTFLAQKSKSFFPLIFNSSYHLDLKTYEIKRYYVSQLVEILCYLRSMNYVHRDLKPSNILINEKWQLVLSDFGTALQPAQSGCLEAPN